MLKDLMEKKERPVFLYTALVAGFVISILQIFISVDLFRDSAGVYVPMARALACGNYAEAFHPAIPSLNVLLSRIFTLVGMSPVQAMTAVGCLFYLLTIVFVYWFLKEFVPEKLAGVGTLLYAFAPKIIRYSCTSLLESSKLFFLIASLYFAYRLIRQKFRSVGSALGFGAMLGGLILARSEGCGNGMVIAGCLGIWFVMEVFKNKKLPPVLPIAAAVVTFLLLFASRIFLMYLYCGKFIFDSRIEEGIHKLAVKFCNFSSIIPSDAVSGTPAAALRVSWAHLFKQNLRGGYEVYLIFACIGIFLFIMAAKWKKCSVLYPDKQVPGWLKWHPFYFVLFIVILSNGLIFKASDLAAYRYFLLNIPLLMIFTLAGIDWVWKWLEKYLPVRLLSIGVALVFFFQVVNGIEYVFSKRSRQMYRTGRAVGKLLDAQNNVGRVWFPGAVREWYYSGMRRALPVESAPVDAKSFRDFEYVLCSINSSEMDILVSRKDLRELPLPQEKNVRLFQRIR